MSSSARSGVIWSKGSLVYSGDHGAHRVPMSVFGGDVGGHGFFPFGGGIGRRWSGAAVYGHRRRVRSAKHEFVFGAGIGSVRRSEGESPAQGGEDHRGLVVGIGRSDAVSVTGTKGDVCVAVSGAHAAREEAVGPEGFRVVPELRMPVQQKGADRDRRPGRDGDLPHTVVGEGPTARGPTPTGTGAGSRRTGPWSARWRGRGRCRGCAAIPRRCRDAASAGSMPRSASLRSSRIRPTAASPSADRAPRRRGPDHWSGRTGPGRDVRWPTRIPRGGSAGTAHPADRRRRRSQAVVNLLRRGRCRRSCSPR